MPWPGPCASIASDGCTTARPQAQQHRASGLALVTAAIVLWNTVYLGRALDATLQPLAATVRHMPACPRLVRRSGRVAVEAPQTAIRASRIGVMPGSTAAGIPQSSLPPAAAMPETPHQPICSRLGAALLKQFP